MPVYEQGIFKDRYQLIPRALIFVTRGESVLLIKGAPTKRIWPNLYNGVGGHIECGEDILTAARREFLEETGLHLSNPWLCALVTIDTGEQTGIGMYVFRGETAGTPQPSPEGTLEWIPFDRLSTVPLVEDLPTLLPRVLTLNRSEAPLYAHYHYGPDKKIMIDFVE